MTLRRVIATLGILVIAIMVGSWLALLAMPAFGFVPCNSLQWLPAAVCG